MSGKARIESPGVAPVVLVTMPFAALEMPSIGLSLLRGALDREGVPSVVEYATLDFARRIGPEAYNAIAKQPGLSCLAGEWLFASALFEYEPEQIEAFFEALREGRLARDALSRHDADEFLDMLRHALSCVPGFLDEWCERVLTREPRFVGLTSVFQQHVASLALAKRLRSARRDLFIAFGGPNCDDAMALQTARSFPFLDAVVYGEADAVFTDLVARALDGRSVEDIAGVYTPAKARRTEIAPYHQESTTPIERMDELPIPRFEDFLEQLAANGLTDRVQPELLLEMSRGCWWGEKHHCTFCGLNDVTMAFRSKSAPRVLEEIEYLAGLDPDIHVTGTDAIFDMRYFRDLVPELTRRGAPLGMYWETKANVRDEHVRGYYGAGFRTVQPGIESLITPVLKLMDKGVTAAQNVRLLRSCEENGVQVLWNHLWAVPGEAPSAYAEVAPSVARLSHLQPPQWMGPLSLLRFSPMHVDPARFGLTSVRHTEVYDWIYGELSWDERENLAYYFDFDLDGLDEWPTYTTPLAQAIREWRAAYHGSVLFWEDDGATVTVWDTRPCLSEARVELRDAKREAFLGVLNPRPYRVLIDRVGEGYEHAVAVAAVEELEHRAFVFDDGAQLINVAVALSDYPELTSNRRATFVRAEKLRLLDRVRALTADQQTVGSVAGQR